MRNSVRFGRVGEAMSETITNIFAIASGVVAILTMVTLLFSFLKPVRKILTRFLFSGTICLLRHEITGMYYEVKERGELRDYEKSDLIMMYEKYERLGGNCYIKQLYQEMLKYPVKTI